MKKQNGFPWNMSEFVTAAFNSQLMLTHFWCLSCRSAPSPIKICCGVWQATSCIPQMHVLTVPLHWLQMGKKLIQRSVLLSTFVFYPCVSFLFLCLLSSTLFQSPLTTCQICATDTKRSTRAKKNCFKLLMQTICRNEKVHEDGTKVAMETTSPLPLTNRLIQGSLETVGPETAKQKWTCCISVRMEHNAAFRRCIIFWGNVLKAGIRKPNWTP